MSKPGLWRLSVIGLLLPMLAQAAVFKSGSEYIVRLGEIIHANTYVAAGNIVVSGDVEGDLVTAGGNVFVSGRTTGDLMIAGGAVNLIGTVDDDLRVAGGNITLNGPVGDDLLIVAGQVNIVGDTMIGGDDAIILAGRVIFNGSAAGPLNITAEEIELGGHIAGPVKLSADKIKINAGAKLEQGLDYRSPTQATIDPTAEILGSVNFTSLADPNLVDLARPSRWAETLFGVFLVAKLLILLITALVLILISRRFSHHLIISTLHRFGRHFLIGLVAVILTPIIAGVLLITLIGAPIALLMLFTYLALIILGIVYAGLIVGSLLIKLIARQAEYELSWRSAVVGVIAFIILGLIPVVGRLGQAIFILTAIGALLEAGYRRLPRLR